MAEAKRRRVVPMAVAVEERQLVAPVTAVCFTEDRNFVLSGSGPYLRVYPTKADPAGQGRQSGQPFYQTKIFDDTSRIHGIRSVPVGAAGFAGLPLRSSDADGTAALYLCFGNRRAGLVELWSQSQSPVAGSAAPAPEIAVKWVSPVLSQGVLDGSTLGDDLVLALTHNYIERWSIATATVTASVRCDVRCILYSAKFYHPSGGDGGLWVASGTVFSEVLLWQPFPGVQHSASRGAVRCRFAGHQGCIFAVDFSADGRRMVSSSDDRSVRLWAVPDLATLAPGVEPTTVDGAVAVMYGHASRVWDVRLLPNAIVSIGEDAILAVWSLDGVVQRKYSGHEGKSIWSVCTAPDLDVVATGGADGGVRVWSTHPADMYTDNASISSEFAVPARRRAPHGADFPRLVTMQSVTRGYVCTDEGNVYAFSVEDAPKFTLLQDSGIMNSVSALEALPGGSVCCAGSVHGFVSLVSADGAFAPICWRAGPTPVLGLYWVPPNPQHGAADNADVADLISTSNGVVFWWRLSNLAGSGVPAVDKIGSFAIDSKAHVQSATMSGRLLWVGDRDGTLYKFGIDQAAVPERVGFPTEPASAFDPSWVKEKPALPVPAYAAAELRVPRLHGKRSITNIVCDPGSAALYTAGRDGYFKEHSTVATAAAPGALPLLAKTKISSKMEWVTRLIHCGHSKFVVLGFEKDCFVTVDVETGQELCRVGCGGGHRSWGFAHGDDFLAAHAFVYVRNRKVNLFRVAAPTGVLRHGMRPVVQPSFHGKEVCCGLMVPGVDGDVDYADGTGGYFVISGGEDCQMRVSRANPASSTAIEIGDAVQGHSSSIRTMVLAEGSAPLLFTGGGQGLLKCWRLRQERGRLTIYLLSEWPPLQKMARDYRLMALLAFATGGADADAGGGAGEHLLLAACSDGVIRVYTFSEETKRFAELEAEFHVYNRCVLSLASVEVANQTVVLAGATDGAVTFWALDRATKHLVPLTKARIHQSGINVLAAQACTGDQDQRKFLVVTVGDDNAVAVGQWTLSGADPTKTSLTEVLRCSMPSAHASCVTALSFVYDGGFATCSVDGRLNVWAVQDVPDLPQQDGHHDVPAWCRLATSALTHVDDAQEIASVAWSDGAYVAVLGCGLHLFKLSTGPSA